MEEHFRSLIESLNRIPNDTGGYSRGKFILTILEDTEKIGLRVVFEDNKNPNNPYTVFNSYYEPPKNVEIFKIKELFIQQCYDEFVRVILFLKRNTRLYEGSGIHIKCIPVADLIRTGIDEINN